MDEGGDSGDEIWADSRGDRRTKLQFQGVGAHPWSLGRRNGLAWGTYNRLIGDARLVSRQILSGVQKCLDAVPSAGRFPAYQVAFGSNPVDLFRWEDDNEDLLLAQDTSPAG